MQTKSLWKNAKAVERLRTLREEGLGFGRIAERLSEEFGVSLTRNAVAGMAYRLSLPRTPVRLPYFDAAPIELQFGEVRLRISLEHLGRGLAKTAA